MMRSTITLRTALSTLLIGGMCLISALADSSVAAADDATIYKIEENWEMVINQPDPITTSPQVTFFTSPSVHSESDYFQLQMNYAADDGFSGGGFHVAAVRDNHIHDEARSRTERTLSTDGERVRWTSVMASIHGKLLFAVKDGHSIEWGDFGGPDYLVKIPASHWSDLSEYHPQQSLNNVDIGFGANRVASVTLLSVRIFYTDGRVITVPVNRQP